MNSFFVVFPFYFTSLFFSSTVTNLNEICSSLSSPSFFGYCCSSAVVVVAVNCQSALSLLSSRRPPPARGGQRQGSARSGKSRSVGSSAPRRPLVGPG